MKVSLTVGDRVVEAAMHDSETTRDFVSLLPLTLRMADLYRREKCARLPRPISGGGRTQTTYAVGDVVYWPPGPDLAIFYRHDGRTIPGDGVVLLGTIESGVDVLSAYDGEVDVTIAVAG